MINIPVAGHYRGHSIASIEINWHLETSYTLHTAGKSDYIKGCVYEDNSEKCFDMFSFSRKREGKQ